jgi:hypothetical protein
MDGASNPGWPATWADAHRQYRAACHFVGGTSRFFVFEWARIEWDHPAEELGRKCPLFLGRASNNSSNWLVWRFISRA